ncbi:hypothetical protein CFOL_v3_04320, partial [Cephalotus follicularis]
HSHKRNPYSPSDQFLPKSSNIVKFG